MAATTPQDSLENWLVELNLFLLPLQRNGFKVSLELPSETFRESIIRSLKLYFMFGHWKPVFIDGDELVKFPLLIGVLKWKKIACR